MKYLPVFKMHNIVKGYESLIQGPDLVESAQAPVSLVIEADTDGWELDVLMPYSFYGIANLVFTICLV